MIDLSADMSGVAVQPRTAPGLAQPQAQNEMTDATSADHGRATTDNSLSDGALAPAMMAQSVNRPAVLIPVPRAEAAKPHKRHRPHKLVRKTTAHDHKLAARRPLISPIDESEKSAPAARVAVTAAGSAVTAAEIPSPWKSALLAQLERYKHYPEAAHAAHEEGTTLLSFTIDRDGHVLDSFVAHSSGFVPLDDETLAMLQRAAPLPKIPPEVPGDTLQLVVPVHFTDE